MKSIFTFIFIVCFFLLKSQYSYVYFQNNTRLSLTTKGVQTGGSLASSKWWATADTIVPWGKTKQVMWMSRDAGITNGVDFYFTLTLKNGSDSIQLKIKENGNLVGSDMWLSSAGNSFSDPWFFDNAFHENFFTWNNKSYSLKYYSYFTGGYDDIRYVLHEINPYPTDTAFNSKATNFSVLAYNIYMLTPPIATTDQAVRGSELANVIHGYDAIILSEAFYNSVRDNNLIPGLGVEYPFHTAVVDKSGATEDGGVMIFSKYPIIKEVQMNYADCDGSDCLAAKGVMYAKINKNGRYYHVFGTHTQAWNAAVDVNVRVSQFQELKNFITAQNIDKNEAVIVGGDLNVDKIVNNLNEYNRMFDSLKAIEPSYSGNPFSYDINLNNYASSGQEFLDYVLPIKNYFVPYYTGNEVRIIRSKADDMFDMNDLSDHFAVYGRLEYPYIISDPTAQNVCEGQTIQLTTNVSHPMFYTWLKNNTDSSITMNNDTFRKLNAQPLDAGNYFCKMSYANGGMLFSDTVLVTIYNKPKLKITNPAAVCLPNTIDLSTTFVDTANVAGTVSYWKDSLCTIPSTATINQSGIYYIKKTATLGNCEAIGKVSATVNPAVTAPAISQHGDTLFSTIAVGNQWYSVAGGMIAGANANYYVPTQNGSYYTVINHITCGQIFSDTLNFIFNGIAENFNDKTVMIYPNPANDFVAISSALAWEKISIQNINGQLIFSNEYIDKMYINISDWAKGMYIIQLVKNDNIYLQKLVIE